MYIILLKSKCAFIIFFLICFLISCRKPIPPGTNLSASGIVFDSVKNKVVPHVKLYLYGAHQGFTRVYYSEGPLDSTISDSQGKFSIHFIADGTSIDYSLRPGELRYGGYYYSSTNYVIDYLQPEFLFNYSRNITNAVVRVRELNFMKIHLIVLKNPFDSFYVKSLVDYSNTILIKGQTIDTTVFIRDLPGELNLFNFYTTSLRDTTGLAAIYASGRGLYYGGWRVLTDSIYTNLNDTMHLDKTIVNSALIPRY